MNDAFTLDAPIATLLLPERKPREIAFTIPYALDSLNIRDRKHFGQKHRDQDRLKMETQYDGDTSKTTLVYLTKDQLKARIAAQNQSDQNGVVAAFIKANGIGPVVAEILAEARTTPLPATAKAICQMGVEIGDALAENMVESGWVKGPDGTSMIPGKARRFDHATVTGWVEEINPPQSLDEMSEADAQAEFLNAESVIKTIRAKYGKATKEWSKTAEVTAPVPA